jgi:16S rRNA (adenine(1408)-N(1))-methyltransferase
VALDLGTGDGRAVLAAAAARPKTLVVGVDANAAAMARSSRRAAPNALFVAAAAEQAPLTGIAHEMTINFPWASLLRGVLGRDDAVLAGIARLAAPGAAISALVSVVERDGLPDVPEPDALAAAYERHGLRLIEARSATADEIAASGSSWAKRLHAGSARPVTRIEAVRCGLPHPMLDVPPPEPS